MTGFSGAEIAIVVCLVLVALFLAWCSLVMASIEAAVSRVTRASLNNLILEEQTSDETDFTRDKHIDKIHRMQRLIDDRFATSGSCAFFRVLFNISDGAVVAVIASYCGSPLWGQVLAGVVFAVIVAFITARVRPRMLGAAQPLKSLMKYERLAWIVSRLAPFASAGEKHLSHQELSDDEELEKLQLEQGRATIDRLAENSDMDPEISEMLRNVLSLSDTLTREIMVPRTDMICIERNETLSSALKMFSRSGFSRMPVIGESVDDLIGMAYMKDAVRAVTYNPKAATRAVETIARKPMLVPETKPVDDLFHQMQRTRQHIAVVVDEYGGIAGLVTIEDTIEQIVGELEDEHDRTQHSEPEKVGEHTWKVPARTPLSDIEELFEIDLDEDDVDTAYGLLTKALGKVPIVGSSAVTRGLRLTAVDSAGRRKKVSTILVEPAGEEFETDADNDPENRTSNEGTDSE
ncbi:MAG: hemolysin family protein [Bifidobacteriaceae bacterium]|nr:hemolysin family protein [Bifidobacteriaceae bacterium]